jgi:hypothetical protein
MKGIVMETLMKVTLSTEKHMAKEFITGQTAKSTMESGKKELKKGMACGKVFTEIAIWASGATLKRMDMEFISGKMVIVMREVGAIV